MYDPKKYLTLKWESIIVSNNREYRAEIKKANATLKVSPIEKLNSKPINIDIGIISNTDDLHDFPASSSMIVNKI